MKMRKFDKPPLILLGRFKGFLFCILLLTGSFAYSQGQANIEVDATFNGGVGNEQGAVPARFRVFMSGVITNVPRTINYTIGGTTDNGADYTTLTGQLFLPMGTGQGFIDILTTDDNFVEGAETVTLTLTASTDIPATYTLPPVNQRSQTITINDNDTGIISMDTTGPQYRPETNEGGGTSGQFRVQSTQPKGRLLVFTVSFTISGTAAGTDFTLTGAVDGTGTMIPYPSGEQTQFRNINVVALDDLDPEDDETVIMTLVSTSRPDLFTIDAANNSATVT
ncbi:MAG: Calx-beta domain-containing protein, partial [Aurantibacter sp.]